ncbi:MAG: hypothetical protein Q4Q23_04905 [Methanobacteriaceae archaeon]|nr:hypothetical protein [Methanobacteriaceae archaeon]
MTSSLMIYSHIIPTIVAILGLFFIINGVMDNNKTYLLLGVIVFLCAAFLPFIYLPVLIT